MASQVLPAPSNLALIPVLITESVLKANANANKALVVLIARFPFAPMTARITEYAAEVRFISVLVTRVSQEMIVALENVLMTVIFFC